VENHPVLCLLGKVVPHLVREVHEELQDAGKESISPAVLSEVRWLAVSVILLAMKG